MLAQNHALAQKLPLTIVFAVSDRTGQRARQHYEFMFAGLELLAARAIKKNVSFMLIRRDELEQELVSMQPAALYADFSPLRAPRRFISKLAHSNNFPVRIVDTHNIVPVWRASSKQEFAARTIRPKIHKVLSDFLCEPAQLVKHPYGKAELLFDASLVAKTLKSLPSNGQKLQWRSGEAAADAVLQSFIQSRLKGYAAGRNDPSIDRLTGLSPYLHFGQMSSLRVVLEVMAVQTPALRPDVDALIEEVVVRKELSDNFCFYNDTYDSLEGAAAWARQTLRQHANDTRDFTYTLDQLEAAETHDDAWNAAQRQLVRTGKMHGYMRMYWAKKSA